MYKIPKILTIDSMEKLKKDFRTIRSEYQILDFEWNKEKEPNTIHNTMLTVIHTPTSKQCGSVDYLTVESFVNSSYSCSECDKFNEQLFYSQLENIVEQYENIEIISEPNEDLLMSSVIEIDEDIRVCVHFVNNYMQESNYQESILESYKKILLEEIQEYDIDHYILIFNKDLHENYLEQKLVKFLSNI